MRRSAGIMLRGQACGKAGVVALLLPLAMLSACSGPTDGIDEKLAAAQAAADKAVAAQHAAEKAAAAAVASRSAPAPQPAAETPSFNFDNDNDSSPPSNGNEFSMDDTGPGNTDGVLDQRDGA